MFSNLNKETSKKKPKKKPKDPNLIQREGQLRTMPQQIMIECCEREKLKELLRERLAETGWRDMMKNYTKDIVFNKGLEGLTVEELSQVIAPKGRAMIPLVVKKEILAGIRKLLIMQNKP